MEKAKAVVIILGIAALVGLGVILFPLIAGLTGFILGVLEAVLPIIVVVLFAALIYKIVEERRKTH